MSRKSQQPKETCDVGEEDDEIVTVKVLQSGTDKKDEIEISLSRTLRELKDMLATNAAVGSIPVQYQRVFFLGRELKTSGRTLSGLGVGRLGVHVLHVHSTSPNRAGAAAAPEITAIDDDDDDDEVVEVAPPTAAAAAATTGRRSKRVVELLLDEDDNAESAAAVSSSTTATASAATSSRRKRRR